MDEYRLTDGKKVAKGTRGVVHWSNGPESVYPDVGVAFRCPCDERLVYIDPKNHSISFDFDGRMTLAPSVGSHESGDPERPDYRPPNWCHFWLKDGKPEMVGDSQCPGKELAP